MYNILNLFRDVLFAKKNKIHPHIMMSPCYSRMLLPSRFSDFIDACKAHHVFLLFRACHLLFLLAAFFKYLLI